MAGTVIIAERESEQVLSLNSYLFTDLLRPILLYKNIFIQQLLERFQVIKKIKERKKEMRGKV